MCSVLIKRSATLVLAVLIGYGTMIFCLGDEGAQLVRQGVTGDVLLRRNFLIDNLAGNPVLADSMATGGEQFVGEWTMGTYAMATYALTNIAMLKPDTAQESGRIIAGWIRSVTRADKANFDAADWGEDPLDEVVLQGNEGHVGYYGHLNLMLGCYALLNNDGRFRELHSRISEAIARRMRKYLHRQIQTYPGETYPPDNTVAAASLRIADMTLGTNYRPLLREWLEATKQLVYPPNGLTVFKIDIATGRPLQPARGVNVGWDSFFLPIVDEEYARVQFDRFKKFEMRRFCGLAAFKEHHQGRWFRGDRDSGPVVFGLGGAATAFAIAGARRSGDAALLTQLLRAVELLGVSVTKGDQRRYLVAPVVGDAIVLAMKTAGPWRVLWRK
jgi:hypothetical protein